MSNGFQHGRTALIYPFPPSVNPLVKYLEWTSEICPNADPSNPLCVIKTEEEGGGGGVLVSQLILFQQSVSNCGFG